MRYTEYHNGVAVIRDKAFITGAMYKLAKYEDREESKLNGDIVRNMNDKQLARLIMCPYEKDGLSCDVNEQGLTCIDCCIDWLKSYEVE